MAELTAGSGARTSAEVPFFLWSAIAMSAIVFGGFGFTYFLPVASGELEVPPVIHVHGFFYFAWMVLLIVQSSLVRQGNVALHRSLGLFGIAVGTGHMIMGSIVTIIFTERAIAEVDATTYGLMYISLLAVFGFAVLFFLALNNLRDPAAHKRFMLLATAAFIIGGVNRILAVMFDLGFEGHFNYLPRYLIVDAFIAALIFYDWRTLGKVHTATLIGTGVNVIPQLLHVPIVDSGAFIALTHWLGGLA